MSFHIPEQTSATYEEVLEIARTAPRVANDDPRIETFLAHGVQPFAENPVMWGNNFFLLWTSLKESDNKRLKRAYRDRALATVGFTDLLEANQALVEDIFTALDDKEPADTLDAKFQDLINRGIEEDDLSTYEVLAAHIDECVGHPMGRFAVTLYVWDQLTPLLQEIGHKMNAANIPFEDFCG